MFKLKENVKEGEFDQVIIRECCEGILNADALRESVFG